MDIETRIRKGFALQSMMKTIGAELILIGDGIAELTAPLSPAFLQHNGFGHAGLTFTLGDTAAGFAAMTQLGADQAVVTSEIGVHLLSPAMGDFLIARGKVIKPGRRQIVSSADVFAVTDGQEKHIATLTGTMVPVPFTP
mgnify:CR=1 FL=1